MLDPIIVEIVNSFKSLSKTKKFRYKDFISYVYFTFEKKISQSKVEKLKNKYIKIREDVLKYILANEKEIVKKICK